MNKEIYTRNTELCNKNPIGKVFKIGATVMYSHYGDWRHGTTSKIKNYLNYLNDDRSSYIELESSKGVTYIKHIREFLKYYSKISA